MTIQTFLCFDLRTSISTFGVFHILFFSFLFTELFYFPTKRLSTEEIILLLVIYLILITLFGCVAYGAYNELQRYLLGFLIIAPIILILLTLVIFFWGLPCRVLHMMFYFTITGFYWYFWYAVVCLYQMCEQNPQYLTNNCTKCRINQRGYNNMSQEAIFDIADV